MKLNWNHGHLEKMRIVYIIYYLFPPINFKPPEHYYCKSLLTYTFILQVFVFPSANHDKALICTWDDVFLISFSDWFNEWENDFYQFSAKF